MVAALLTVFFKSTDTIGTRWANKHRFMLVGAQIAILVLIQILIMLAMFGTSAEGELVKALSWVNIEVRRDRYFQSALDTLAQSNSSFSRDVAVAVKLSPIFMSVCQQRILI